MLKCYEHSIIGKVIANTEDEAKSIAEAYGRAIRLSNSDHQITNEEVENLNCLILVGDYNKELADQIREKYNIIYEFNYMYLLVEDILRDVRDLEYLKKWTIKEIYKNLTAEVSSNLIVDGIEIDNIMRSKEIIKDKILGINSLAYNDFIWNDANNELHSFRSKSEYLIWLKKVIEKFVFREMESYKKYWKKKSEVNNCNDFDKLDEYIIK